MRSLISVFLLISIFSLNSALARDEVVTGSYFDIEERLNASHPVIALDRLQLTKKKGKLSYVFIYPKRLNKMPQNGNFSKLIYNSKRKLGTQMSSPNRNVQHSSHEISLILKNPVPKAGKKPGTIKIRLKTHWNYPDSRNTVRPSRDSALAILSLDSYANYLHQCMRDFQEGKMNMFVNIAKGSSGYNISCQYR